VLAGSDQAVEYTLSTEVSDVAAHQAYYANHWR
jgi:hypothetical protein